MPALVLLTCRIVFEPGQLARLDLLALDGGMTAISCGAAAVSCGVVAVHRGAAPIVGGGAAVPVGGEAFHGFAVRGPQAVATMSESRHNPPRADPACARHGVSADSSP